MISSLRRSCVLLLLILAPLCAHASPRLLDDAAWRGDLAEMAATVKENHPAPYRHVSEEDFNSAVEALDTRIPKLTDKQIIVEMAKIIALVSDGHTRLSIPRQHHNLAFSFSHSSPKEPTHKAMNFASLPFRFQVLEGGLYIVKASEQYAHLVGAEVIAFGDTPVADALAMLSSVNYAENRMTDILLQGDRAGLPEVLAALGVTASSDETALTLRPFGDDKTIIIAVAPLGPEPVELIAPEKSQSPLWLSNIAPPKWATPLKQERTHFIQLNQIEGGVPEVFLADFMKTEIEKAKRARAKKIILDLRHNHGGNGGAAHAVINTIVTSPYNEYGKFMVITGRETFSAAGHLLTEIEQYTDAVIFGEATSAAPDSYGDPKRIQLENSGLDLRVSRLHWGSWRAFDDRDTYTPHIPVPYTIDDYMNGRDPALEAALNYRPPANFAALISDFAAEGISWDGIFILFSRYSTDPRVQPIDIAALVDDLLVEAGNREKATENAPAKYLYEIVGLLDEDRVEAYLGQGRSALALNQTDGAREAVEAGLAVFPANQQLLKLKTELEKL